MKKSAFMIALAALFALLSVALLLCGCEKEETDGEDTTAAESTIDAIPIEEAERIMDDLLTPSREGAFALGDGVVYTDREYTDKYIFERVGDLEYYYEVGKRGEKRLICRDGDCAHSDIRCPAYKPSILITVGSEGSDDLVIYYLYRFYYREDSVGGQFLDSTYDRDVLFEYNVKTGERRTVRSFYADDPITFGSAYYNGSLYLQGFEVRDGNISRNTTALVMDAVTGEIKYPDCEAENIPAGIYDGHVYLAAENGSLIRCDLDLSGCETAAKLGEGKYGGTVQMSGNMIYFLGPLGGDGFSSLRCIDLDDPELRAREIEEKAVSFYASDGCAYFTKYDPHEYGYYGAIEISSATGGTLYRYDADSGEIATVFEDCGADVEGIPFANGEYIRFTGCWYGKYGTDYNYTGNGLDDFIYYFDSGELIHIGE